jgi:hypothetical protein
MTQPPGLAATKIRAFGDLITQKAFDILWIFYKPAHKKNLVAAEDQAESSIKLRWRRKVNHRKKDLGIFMRHAQASRGL